MPPVYYERLLAYADAHRWSVAYAGRIIICDFLDHVQEEEEKVP